MFEEDQKARLEGNINWKVLIKQDSVRRVKVFELIEKKKVVTSNDYYHAAIIFQHGTDSISYRMAWNYSKRAFSIDTTNHNARWLSAASFDRYLLSIGKPQIYGTQFMIRENKWYLRDFDTTKITDAERILYGARTLSEIKEFLRKKNGENEGLLFYPKSKK